MNEPDWESCDEESLWAFVAWHLSGAGIDSVLVGGAVVAVYTEGLYQSKDIDLIADDFKRDQLEQVLAGIGFEKTKSRYFMHPRCRHLVVEFPPGPVSLGEQRKVEPSGIEIEGRRLLLLSPTDCVKDRMASYIHWGTRDCFDQAVLVIRRQEVDLDEVRRWCRKEGGEEAFQELLEHSGGS